MFIEAVITISFTALFTLGVLLFEGRLEHQKAAARKRFQEDLRKLTWSQNDLGADNCSQADPPRSDVLTCTKPGRSLRRSFVRGNLS